MLLVFFSSCVSQRNVSHCDNKYAFFDEQLLYIKDSKYSTIETIDEDF